MRQFFTGLPSGKNERQKDALKVKAAFEMHRDEDNPNNPFDGLEDGGYCYFDSRSVGGWTSTMSRTFSKFLSENQCESIGEYLKKVWGEDFKDRVGLEIGGPGRNFFADSNPDGKHFSKTIGITAQDIMDKEESAFYEGYLPELKDHKVVEANAFDVDTYHALAKDKLKDGKADFILERMWGGLHFAPTDPFKLFELLNAVYRLLSDDGVMMIELPRSFGEDAGVGVMKEFASINSDEKLQIYFCESSGDHMAPILIIKKNNKGAKQSLEPVPLKSLYENKEDKKMAAYYLKSIEKYFSHLKRSIENPHSQEDTLYKIHKTLAVLQGAYAQINYTGYLTEAEDFITSLDLGAFPYERSDDMGNLLYEEASVALCELRKLLAKMK